MDAETREARLARLSQAPQAISPLAWSALHRRRCAACQAQAATNEHIPSRSPHHQRSSLFEEDSAPFVDKRQLCLELARVASKQRAASSSASPELAPPPLALRTHTPCAWLLCTRISSLWRHHLPTITPLHWPAHPLAPSVSSFSSGTLHFNFSRPSSSTLRTQRNAKAPPASQQQQLDDSRSRLQSDHKQTIPLNRFDGLPPRPSRLD